MLHPYLELQLMISQIITSFQLLLFVLNKYSMPQKQMKALEDCIFFFMVIGVNFSITSNYWLLVFNFTLSLGNGSSQPCLRCMPNKGVFAYLRT